MGRRARTAGIVVPAQGTGLAMAPGLAMTWGWVRVCWLLSNESRSAGRLFCREKRKREGGRDRERERM